MGKGKKELAPAAARIVNNGEKRKRRGKRAAGEQGKDNRGPKYPADFKI